MSSTISSKQLADRIRWRHIVDAADPARIRALVASAGVFSPEEIDIAGALAETTLDKSETYRFLFAERGADLLGYTCFDRIPLSSVSFDLYWIAVRPEERGNGLARQLLERTATFIRSKRGLQLFAETSSREPYAAARAFYLKAGLEEAARFEDFYAVGDAKLVFRLKL
jgi:ribosomal protein S18 acetylase RimI-like enzyme